MSYPVTVSATNVTDNGATLNGISANNNWPPYFIYGLSKDVLAGAADVPVTGAFYTDWNNHDPSAPLSEYSDNITGLIPGKLYYFRAAYFVEDYETYLGDIKSFMTIGAQTVSYYDESEELKAADIVTLEAVRNIEIATMGRFYIDEEGRATFESRYGRNV